MRLAPLTAKQGQGVEGAASPATGHRIGRDLPFAGRRNRHRQRDRVAEAGRALSRRGTARRPAQGTRQAAERQRQSARNCDPVRDAGRLAGRACRRIPGLLLGNPCKAAARCKTVEPSLNC